MGKEIITFRDAEVGNTNFSNTKILFQFMM